MKRWMRLLVCALLAAFAVAAAAGPLRYRTSVWEYQAEGESVRNVLLKFAASQGLLMQVDESLTGELNARFKLATPTVLDTLSSMAGLIWYHDGNIVYVYPAAAARTEVLSVSVDRAAELTAALERLGIFDPRYPVSVEPRAGVAMVSGPPRYTELVRAIAKIVDDSASRRGSAQVRVFRLKYAWADDFQFSLGGRDISVPGVASVLRDVFGQNKGGAERVAVVDSDGSSSAADKASRAGVLKLPRTPPAGGSRPAGSSGERAIAAAARGSPSPLLGESSEPGSIDFDVDIPRFRAEGRINAVVVRDVSERMAQYEQLIAALDVRPFMVEIEASIMSIDRNALESIGIDWRFVSSNATASSGSGTAPQPPRSGFDSITAGAAGVLPAGGVLTTLTGNASRFFLARVQALAEKGDARVTARPRVLTLDSTEALIEDAEQFYVRVNGAFDTSLFTVNSGTTLRVTPLVINDNDLRRIKLAIRIEDGRVTDQRIDGLPLTTRSGIGTQAFISEGDSLLIGGYSVEEDTSRSVGVPGLSKIPVLGALFRTDERTARRAERFFLITPRVLTL
jgi:type III secretion protein C